MTDSNKILPAPLLAVVVPCFNESEALPVSVPRMLSVLDRMCSDGLISAESYLMLVDDGSRDNTWQLICEYHSADKRVRGITLAHNRGHQYALLAGIHTVADRCDAAISIDADLQDDPDAMIEMVKAYRAGAEIVFGVRSDRRTDSWFKRTTAHAFYSFQRAMGLKTVYDHADYRLMSSRALQLLSEYGESNLFLRGIIPQIGLTTAVVTYSRDVRVAGESKYPLSKMLALSIDGITSFSARPMRWIFFTGLATFLLTIIVGIYVLVSYFFGQHTTPGWPSIMLSIWFLGSLILMAIGIVGEYVGKIFVEVKHRPRYAVKEEIWN